jgi:hypothetical protein
MNHTILVEDFISPSFFFLFFFFRITKHLSRFTRDKNLIFFLMEESIYEAIVSTHSYWILAI